MSYIMNVCRGGKLDVAHFATSLDANEVAFQDIFMQFYPLVYSVALRATADPIEAEDVAQEVCLRLFRRGPALVIKTSLSAWLTRVALNLSFNSRRSRSGPRRQKRRRDRPANKKRHQQRGGQQAVPIRRLPRTVIAVSAE